MVPARTRQSGRADEPGRARRAWAAAGRFRRERPLLWRAALALALFAALLEADAICSNASLPVVVTRDPSGLSVRVGSVTRTFATRASLVGVSVPPRDPTYHEYQLDGTDTTNNFTLDPDYLHSIASSAYYRFTAWMRGLDDLSRWRDVCASADGAHAHCLAAPPIARGASLAVPGGTRQRVTARLQQPETPVTLDLSLSDGSAISLTVDRNDHIISIAQLDPAHPDLAPVNAYYPNDPGDTWPLAAMVLDLLIRVLLWSLAMLAAVWAVEAALGWLLARLRPAQTSPQPLSLKERGVRNPARADGPRGAHALRRGFTRPRFLTRPRLRASSARQPSRGATVRRPFGAALARLTAAIHPAGLALVAASFGFTLWITLAQYHAQPHIYDAAAYLFGAKIFASGHLSAPAPVAPNQFPGPFMVVANGRWFPQYEPGTSAALAVGVALGVPWLIEPLMGALALLATGLTLRRLYDRRVATLAVALGAISPFYLWLTASYLSHAVALCALAWGLWALVRFAQGGRGWNLPLAIALWGAALLTRETALPFALVALAGVGWLAWRERWPVLRRRIWAAPLAWTALALATTLAIYLDYNAILTGWPLVSPRTLFAPGDHWGFGPGIGFYGQHTLAAGFITVNELLTSLSISLFGWPFYLTLAFIPLPFLARRARAADAVLLAGALVMVFSFLGYFYHGVYLGPRYLFEALPFLLGLTARGVLILLDAGRAARATASRATTSRATTRQPEDADLAPTPRRAWWAWSPPALAAPALLLALLACAALYYVPRQIALYSDFSGLPAGQGVHTAALGRPPFHHAIIITDSQQLYGYTLFALNDPALRGDILYAYAAGASDEAALRRAYPSRALYVLTFDTHGNPVYTLISGLS